MFVGREEEIQIFERLLNSPRFEFLILYGRRRIGKTYLLQELAQRHKCIFFSAMEKNDAANLRDFSKIVQFYFDDTFIAPFEDWTQAFEYIGKKSEKQRTLVIIDEFPFIAEENPSVKSILQHQIDKSWLKKNIMLVLCGSNISFMETEVMGEKSPLYGRSTAQLEIKKFDYFTASKFFPKYSVNDKLIVYGILGGVPRYLAEFNPSSSIKENLQSKILQTGTFLKEEPISLLKMEVRETNVYNSILQAVAGGTNRISEIAAEIHEEQTKVNKYITTLQNLRLIEKVVPCGENEKSKKGIYKITDNFLCFWYRYEFANRNYYNFIGDKAATKEIMDGINDYMGLMFEDICKQYLIHLAQKGKLPFTPYYLGKWWGNNPAIKAQDDVDILVMDKAKENAIFCECKFTNKKFDTADFDDMLNSIKAFPNLKKSWIYIFSKSGWTTSVEVLAKKHKAKLISTENMF